MRLRNWAFAGAAVLLLLAALIPARNHFIAKKAADKQAAASLDGGRRARHPSVRPSGSSKPVVASPPVAEDGGRVGIPDLSSVVGSCIQDDGRGGQVCTDFIGTQAEVDDTKMKCRKTKRYFSATWVDSPCDHAASHGGCWAAKQKPAKIRWFFGEAQKDFVPGRDTHRVCGAYSLAFAPDGTPVATMHGGDAGPAGPADDEPQP